MVSTTQPKQAESAQLRSFIPTGVDCGAGLVKVCDAARVYPSPFQLDKKCSARNTRERQSSCSDRSSTSTASTDRNR